MGVMRSMYLLPLIGSKEHVQRIIESSGKCYDEDDGSLMQQHMLAIVANFRLLLRLRLQIVCAQSTRPCPELVPSHWTEARRCLNAHTPLLFPPSILIPEL